MFVTTLECDTGLFKLVTIGIEHKSLLLLFTLHFRNQTTPRFLAPEPGWGWRVENDITALDGTSDRGT